MKLVFLSALKGPRSGSPGQNPNLDWDFTEFTIIFYKLIPNPDIEYAMITDGHQFSNTALSVLFLVTNLKI